MNHQTEAERRRQEFMGVYAQDNAEHATSNYAGNPAYTVNSQAGNFGRLNKKIELRDLTNRGSLTFTIAKDTVTLPVPTGLIAVKMFKGINPSANTGAIVNMQEGDYKELLTQSISTPFLLRMPNLSTNEAEQFNQLLTYRRKTLFGKEVSDSITPSVFSRADSYHIDRLDSVPFEMIIDGHAAFEFFLLNSATMTLNFKVFEFESVAQAAQYAKENGLFRKVA